MILLAVLIVIVTLLSVGLLTTQITAARYSSISWHELVERLQAVDMAGIEVAAREYLRPQEAYAIRSEGDKLRLIGGTEGLTRMRHNVDVMIALAARAQGWGPEAAVETAELMRRDANKVKSGIVGQGLGRTIGYGKHRVGSYVTQAGGAYYLMVQRLLALYERGHGARRSNLEDAVSQRPRRLPGRGTSVNYTSFPTISDIPATEIADLLRKVVRGENRIVLLGRSWQDNCWLTAHAHIDGYKLSIQNDCNYLEYIVSAVAPDGRRYQLWSDEDEEPVSLLTSEEVAQIERLLRTAKVKR